MSTDNPRKDSEIQAAEGAADPELESLIAPQGYDADLVDDVATMETPAQQRKKAIRFLFYMFLRRTLYRELLGGEENVLKHST